VDKLLFFEFTSFMVVFLSLQYFPQIQRDFLMGLSQKPLLEKGFSFLNCDLPF